jgi:hypothetical protein
MNVSWRVSEVNSSMGILHAAVEVLDSAGNVYVTTAVHAPDTSPLEMLKGEITATVQRAVQEETERRAVRSVILGMSGAADGSIIEGYGKYSGLEQEAREERFAGKGAAIDFIVANPECTEEEAILAYSTAALAARPSDRQYILLNPASLLKEYRKNAVVLSGEGKLPMTVTDTWESFRTFLLLMPKEALMGMDVT